jgi:hypothetical protein
MIRTAAVACLISLAAGAAFDTASFARFGDSLRRPRAL